MSSNPKRTARLMYAPQPGVVPILSDNCPRSLAMVTSWGFKQSLDPVVNSPQGQGVTSWGFKRLPAAQPGEAYRCKRDDGRYVVIVDDAVVDIVLPAGGVE